MEDIYENSEDNKYRYALGTTGSNSLLCFGVNSSTAEPGNLDPTVTKVSKIAAAQGYDSWIMFNLYPQRATEPEDMEQTCNKEQHGKNVAAIEKYVKENAVIVAAWGDIIETRPYLFECLQDIVNKLKGKHIRWLQLGDVTVKGNPRHPLYVKTDTPLQPFDINGYMAQKGK